MKIGEAIYAAQQGAGDDSDGEAGSGEAAASSGDDNVVDADFEEVKDDKKKSA
jgi:molecular chaperone DnaK